MILEKRIRTQMRMPYLCRRCYREGHKALDCLDKDRLCEKCGCMGHCALACGIKCRKCSWTGHFDHECQNQAPSTSTNTMDARLVERLKVTNNAQYRNDLEEETRLKDLFVV